MVKWSCQGILRRCSGAEKIAGGAEWESEKRLTIILERRISAAIAAAEERESLGVAMMAMKTAISIGASGDAV